MLPSQRNALTISILGRLRKQGAPESSGTVPMTGMGFEEEENEEKPSPDMEQGNSSGQAEASEAQKQKLKKKKKPGMSEDSEPNSSNSSVDY